MKNLLLAGLFLLALSLMATACEKKTTEPEPEDPAPTFYIAFILADSAGNNLLPYNLPEDPVFDPEDFSALSDRNDSIGYYTRNSKLGHVFWMRGGFYEITNDPDYQKDSTFVFYPFFGQDSDTVTIYKTSFSLADTLTAECFAEMIIWNRDTFHNYHCTLLPIQNF